MSLFILLISLQSFADEIRLKVLNRVQFMDFKLGIGSEVELDGKKGVFIGRMINHPTHGEEFLFLNERSGKILMVDLESLRSSISRSDMQPLISTIDQAGETCAAYAIYHFWMQLGQFTSEEKFEQAFGEEHSRIKFLEEALTTYYMGRTTNLNTIMNKFGKRFEYKCRDRVFDKGEEAIAFIAAASGPVLMEFYIGPKMVRSPNQLKDFETNDELDDRLWIPRKIGEKNSGGHAIVAAGSFVFKGKKKIVVLDSNWNEPRVWDADSYLNQKTAISEMIFHSCH